MSNKQKEIFSRFLTESRLKNVIITFIPSESQAGLISFIIKIFEFLTIIGNPEHKKLKTTEVTTFLIFARPILT